MTELDRFHIGLIERIARWTALTALFVGAAVAAADRRGALGLAFGAALGLALLGLHRRMLTGLVERQGRLAGAIASWALWSIKWPALGVLLYFGLRSGWLAPGWFCLGVGLPPAVAVALAVRALALEGWRAVRARP